MNSLASFAYAILRSASALNHREYKSQYISNAGRSKTVNIPVDQAYGPYNNELISVADRDKLPEGMNPEVGQQLQAQQPDGQTRIVTVIDISETTITVDGNHPLAGKDLTCEIELIEIQ